MVSAWSDGVFFLLSGVVLWGLLVAHGVCCQEVCEGQKAGAMGLDAYHTFTLLEAPDKHEVENCIAYRNRIKYEEMS